MTSFLLHAVSPEGSVAVSPSITTADISGIYNYSIICNALGGPNNTYQWEKNGIILGNDHFLEIINIDSSSGGEYTCTVNNTAGSGSDTAFFYVAPYIVTPLQEVTLTASGDFVNINCYVAGFPSPSVEWFDMNDTIVSNTSLLQFSPVTFGNEGLYRCVATAVANDMNFTATDKTTVFGIKQYSYCLYCVILTCHV